jgi:excisionase family DNA binding protein
MNKIEASIRETVSRPFADTSTAELLSIAQVAHMLRVPPSWVYDHTRKRTVNRIPGFRLGKYWRFLKEDVIEWLERQRTNA